MFYIIQPRDNVQLFKCNIAIKLVLIDHSKGRSKYGFQDGLSLNAGQKYCRMLQSILSTFFKLLFVFKMFVLSIFKWPLKTGFTVLSFRVIVLTWQLRSTKYQKQSMIIS